MTSNYSDQAGIQLATQTDQFTVTPGGKLEIAVFLTNLGSTPDQLRISVEGIPLFWVSSEQQVVFLQPGERSQIIMIVQPPAPPDAHAGRYSLRLHAASTLDPARIAQAQVTLTVAGFEVKGRVGVLLDGVQYSIVPGDQLAIPVVMINQGLSPDTFNLALEGLPEGWVSNPTPEMGLGAGEETTAILVVQPARHPSSLAGRYPFRIQVTSEQAPSQGAIVDCNLTVGAFVAFNSSLEAAQPDQELPTRVRVQNLSNFPVTFQVLWTSPEDSLVFEPKEPQQVNLPVGETADLAYAAKPARRYLVGGKNSYDYYVTVQSSDGQTQVLKGALIQKALLPVWAVAVGGILLLLCCLFLVLAVLLRGQWIQQPTAMPTQLTSTMDTLLPTATQSQVDQKPLLVSRNWYLVAYNQTHSSPGMQEAFILFNPDTSLIGYTGCKDLNAVYQTSFNQITISNINLSRGTCSDQALQQQEDAMVAILRSARSYYVADTALQVAGDVGFLNYSLSPMDRPEEILPPQAVIQIPPQGQAIQNIVFNGSGSTGQVPLVSWKWDFGDGNVASGVIVQHAYRDPGVYKVQLTVTDQRSQSGSSAQQILILPLPTPTVAPTLQPEPTKPSLQPTPTNEPPPQLNPPQAKIDGPRNGFLGEPVEFDASSSREGSSPIVSYSWSFGNGSDQSASSSPRVSTIYDRAGYYEITVTIVDANGLSSNASTRITIDARLKTQVWTLSSINGQTLLPGTAITLQFLEGELAGFAGCNTYQGRYTTADNSDGTYSVTIEKIIIGRRSCPVDILTQESEYMVNLEQVTIALIQENMLTLNFEGGTLVFYLINAP